MRGGARRLAAVVGVVWALGAGQAARGQDAPAAPAEPTEEAFLAALDRAKANVNGLAGEAKRLLLEALEANRGRPWVAAKRAAVEDLARRIAFRAECPPPDPQTVVKGRLRKFVSSSGAIDIVYEAGKPSDLELKGGGLLFPARFRGPHTVTVKGDAYPDGRAGVPAVQLCTDDDPKTKQVRAWVVGFGVPPESAGASWVPPRILSVVGTEQKMLAERKTAHPMTPGKGYRLEATAGGSRLTATINGTSVGSVAKPDGAWGYALVAVPGWREIAFEGQIEPSWIQSRLDAAVDGKRKAFDAGFDVHRFLPAWFFEAPKAPVATAPRREGGLTAPPADLPPGARTAWVRALATAAAGDEAEALAALEAVRGQGASAATVALLSAQVLAALGQPTKALAALGPATAGPGVPVEALVLRASLEVRLGRDAALGATLDAILAHPDAGTEAREAAGTLFLLAGRLDDARRLSEDAARKGLRSPGLERLGRVVVRAQNGPEWPRSFDYKTTNYHVSSDIDLETCRRTADLLEQSLADFRGAVKALQPGARKVYRVFLFSGRAGFDAYTADALSIIGKTPERTAGLFSPVLKQLLVWNLPERDEMMHTVRHEGFHQYLDRLLPDPPVWFNEGLAVYFEETQRVGGTLKTDVVRGDLLDRLKGRPLIPMAELVRITPAQFYGDASRTYAQAWLVAHLLRHGSARHTALYRDFLGRLESAAGPEAVGATFDEATCRALDADLAAHQAALGARR